MSRKTAKADVIPVRQQNQYNCMTTSLAMALRALGVPDEECAVQRVNKVVGAMPLRGAAWEPLLAAANHYGMRATLTLPSTVRQLKQWTDAGTPVVIAWNPENREWSHASLVFDVDDDLNVYVADPNIPDPDETVRVVPKGEFYGKWYEKSPQGFLIRRPACAIQREITADGRQVMASRQNASPQKVAHQWMVDTPKVQARDPDEATTMRSAKKSKGKKTTEIRRQKTEDEKFQDKINRQPRPKTRKGPEYAEWMRSRKTDQDKRKRRTKRKRDVPRGNTKHKKRIYASAARVATMYLLSRQTNELIRMKYKNLGDFGGTDPIVDSWILDVAGPYEAMQEIMPILKKHKFRWDPASKSWGIHARKYAYNNRKRQNFWNAARRNQKAAYPILKKKIDEINAALRAEDATPKPTRRELLRQIHQEGRISDRLKKLGIEVEYDYPDRYSVDEAKVWLRNTPFDLNPVLKKHGFRWGSGRNGKGWYIPMREYAAILKRLVADIFRAMPLPDEADASSGGTGVFSDMSHRELSRWLDPVVSRDMEFNEGYDGEVSRAEVKRQYMKKLPALKPHEQEQAMQNWLRGDLPSVSRRRR